MKIAFLADFSLPEATELVLPASQAATLAVSEAEAAGRVPVDVEIEPRDTGGGVTEALETARELADDPEVVGVIVAPFTQLHREVGDVLDAAGIATVSLSTLGPDLATYGWESWRRAVPEQSRQAVALASFAEGLTGADRGACVVGDATPASIELERLVSDELRERRISVKPRLSVEGAPSAETAEEIRRSGCGVLVWTGFGEPAAQLATLLDSNGDPQPPLVAADATKSETFLADSGAAGSGTVVVCPCVDVTASTRIEDQRFINAFQFHVGPTPGIYTAEGYDVARMFLAALVEGGTTRATVATGLSNIATFEGVGGAYAFADDGRLEKAGSRIHLFRARSGRWSPVAP